MHRQAYQDESETSFWERTMDLEQPYFFNGYETILAQTLGQTPEQLENDEPSEMSNL